MVEVFSDEDSYPSSTFEKIKNKILLIFTLPLSQFKGFKYIEIFVDDLEMYFYDNRHYNQTMQDLLLTINMIEQIKWSLLNYKSKVPINQTIVPMSDLTAFSNPKHKEVDDVDDSFARSLFPCMVFLVPQTIILVLILNRIFTCIADKKYSVYIRRYFFVLPCVIQIVVENNMPFFTYIFFRQAMVAFSFNFTDKLFIAVAVVVFFLMMMAGICFYFLFDYLYKKRFGYFIYCFYRCFPSMVFLTFRMFVRGFARGVIHSTLHSNYWLAIVLLSALEVAVIVLAIWLEKKHKIFMTQTMFCLTLIYHFVFLLLNPLLFVEEMQKGVKGSEQVVEVLLFFEKVVVYTLLSLVVTEFLVDFIPTSRMRP